jgi:hypothetical protein
MIGKDSQDSFKPSVLLGRNFPFEPTLGQMDFFKKWMFF